MIPYARAGERCYGTRTNERGQLENYHACTVRHDIFLGELPDFPACLGDWQQEHPPVQRHFITELVNAYTTHTDTLSADGVVIERIVSTATAITTKTSFVDLEQHGSGEAPQFGVVWSGESWWRPYEHDVGGERLSLHYDLRFRGTNGTCTWRMEEIEARNPA